MGRRTPAAIAKDSSIDYARRHDSGNIAAMTRAVPALPRSPATRLHRRGAIHAVRAAANVHMSGRDGIERHTVLHCYGIACYQESFLWGTCRLPHEPRRP